MSKDPIAEPKFIVVVGTSAGGIKALEEFVMQLSPDMDAAFFIVLHLSRKGIGDILFQRLQQYTTLPCKAGVDGELIERGKIYLAPPDEHLLVDKGRVVIGRGAPENRWRPSINNLFRSAAAAYDSKVIGIILTGLLDDGSAGMAAIKRSGGITVVQDPNEADYPDMPLSVLENMEVDYTESLSKMGILLSQILSGPEPERTEPPEDIVLEAELDQRVSIQIDNLESLEKSEINCPDCGGGLYITQKDHPAHYRCHVGHSYTDRELLIRMSEVLESTFWTSLRMLEERRTILVKLAKKNREKGYGASASRYEEQSKEMEKHIDNLKQILFASTRVE